MAQFTLTGDYSDFVASRISPHATKSDECRLMHIALGLATEAGEFADPIKKAITKDTAAADLDHVNFDEEIGDILFYIQDYCNYRGTTIAQLAKKNYDKLSKRYAQGFTAEASDNRDLDAERKILEGD